MTQDYNLFLYRIPTTVTPALNYFLKEFYLIRSPLLKISRLIYFTSNYLDVSIHWVNKIQIIKITLIGYLILYV